MLGLSTFLLVTCGLVSIQAYRRSSGNANMKTKVNGSRRYYNGNGLNRDGFAFPYMSMQMPQAYYNDEADDGAKVAVEQGDEKIDALANTAGTAALAITKKLADDMGDSVSIAIADAVARILNSNIRRIPRDSAGRRNSNFNSNYNLNIMGHAGLQNSDDRQLNADDNDSQPDGSGDAITGDSGPLQFLETEYGTKDYLTNRESLLKDRTLNNLRPPYLTNLPATPEMSVGILHDDENVADVEEPLPLPAETAAVPTDMLLQDENTPVPEQPLTDGRLRGNANINNNVNTNNFEPSGFRRNFNSNSNQNMFRRNLNANSNANFNSYRRSNANYNSNSNRMDPHHHYHQK